MQPESPQKPIMDVAAPPRTEPVNGALPMHEPPATAKVTSTLQQAKPVAQVVTKKDAQAKSGQRANQSASSTAVIVVTLCVMLLLSSVTFIAYLQSKGQL